jgi:hypothetical protein
MTAKLPDELRTVVYAHPGELLELMDEQTHLAYMLVSTVLSGCGHPYPLHNFDAA